MNEPVIIGDATLYCADCLEILPTLGKADHVITDPPYEQISQDRIGGIKRNDGGRVTQKLRFAGIDAIRDETLAKLPDGFKWGLFFCTSEGVALWRDAIERAKLKYKTCMIWVKPDAMPKFNGQCAAVGHENIVSCWAGDGHSKWNGGGRRGVFTHITNAPDRHGVHPTEKPLALMKEIVSLFTNPGETILDPFMGSGTTGVACNQMGRKFIGIERDRKYFAIACKRIEQAYSQPDFFIAPPVERPKQESML
jgi:site-specific DNA-methyltransferase (adenine-specific)